MRKKYLIITLIISLTLIIGGTFAWLSWQSEENTNFTLNIGEVAEVFFTGGNEIKASGIGPVISEEEGEITEFQILKKIEDPIILQVSFNPSVLPEGLKEESFKYKLYSKTNEKENYTLITEGNFKDKIQGTEFTLIDELEVSSNTSYYRFIIYIDGNMLNPSTMKGQDFEGTILITSKSKGTPLTTIITDKYNNTSKSPVVNNNITYNYATSESLMADMAGNIRYYGKVQNNYIYFNCVDYNNQTADTCEVWRIIGVFGDKIKIIRNETLASYSWDNKNTVAGSEDNFGKNDWTTARLMKLLNPSDYYKIDSNDNGIGQSLYYNSESGTCFSGLNNATKSCDFTKSGIKNNETKDKIAEVTWNLGGWNSTSLYSNQIYTYERGNNAYTPSRPKIWNGKIALMYPSDYGYATDFTKCIQTLINYDSSTNSYACRANNWLYTNNYQWLLTPYSGNSHYVWRIDSLGFVRENIDAFSEFGIRPTLFLTSDQVVGEDGKGTLEEPYQLLP